MKVKAIIGKDELARAINLFLYQERNVDSDVAVDSIKVHAATGVDGQFVESLEVEFDL